MKKRVLLLLLAVLLLTLAGCGQREEDVSLDLDAIAAALTESGQFPASLEEQDPGLVSTALCLYEDRIEAAPEDVADARYSMALGMVADQFILLEGTDEAAADRLEQALTTYAQDQRSAYEFYSPDQAIRMDDPVVVRRGRYLLFAVGADPSTLEDLCDRLMAGETVELSPTASPEPEAPAATEAEADSQESETPALSAQEIEEAQQAALDYYAGTVFTVHSLTQVSSGEGEIVFRVACAKGGEEQPDRSITLEMQNGAWVVVNEGY